MHLKDKKEPATLYLGYLTSSYRWSQKRHYMFIGVELKDGLAPFYIMPTRAKICIEIEWDNKIFYPLSERDNASIEKHLVNITRYMTENPKVKGSMADLFPRLYTLENEVHQDIAISIFDMRIREES